MKSSKRKFSVLILAFLAFLIGCATLEKGGGGRGRLKEPRIKPLAESEWNAEQQKLLNPQKAAHPSGRVVNINATLANHIKLAERWFPWSTYIFAESTLPPREREILILRIGWLCRSEYEFGQHTLFGKLAGLTEGEIRRVTEGPKAPGWDAFDVTLLQAVDELHADAFITDTTWNALAKRYNKQQLIDLVATVGQYNLISMLLNSLGVQLDEGVPGFPTGKDK